MLRVLKENRATGHLASLSKSREAGVQISMWQVLAQSFGGDIEYIDPPGWPRQLLRYLFARRQFRGDRFFSVSISPYTVCALLTFMPVCMMCWSTPNQSLRRLIFGFFVRRCRTVIVNDTLTRDELIRDFGVAAGRIVFLPYGVDDGFFRPSDAKTPRRLIFPGSAHRDETIVGEILEHTDWSVVRLTNDASVGPLYEDYARRYGGRVELHRNLPHDRVPGIYAQCSACVLHVDKHNEPAGLTCLLEAFASGLPVFTNSAKTGTDYITPGETGALYRRPQELIDILRAGGDAQFVRMGAAARRWLEDKASWPVLQSRYEDALKR